MCEYLYEVRPIKPIVEEGRTIRRPSSFMLSKDEVKRYMEKANIWRRFPDHVDPIRVIGAELDFIHCATFKEYTDRLNNNYTESEEDVAIVENNLPTPESLDIEVTVNVGEQIEPEITDETPQNEEVVNNIEEDPELAEIQALIDAEEAKKELAEETHEEVVEDAKIDEDTQSDIEKSIADKPDDKKETTTPKNTKVINIKK